MDSGVAVRRTPGMNIKSEILEGLRWELGFGRGDRSPEVNNCAVRGV